MKIHSCNKSTGPKRPVNGPKNQSGLTILEVLIALVVLSIGLAGLAIMHMNSLKYVHSAYYRSVASAIALDFEERLWLRLADNTVTDCPDLTDGSVAHAALLSDWSRSEVSWTGFGTSRLVKIQNLTVEPGTLSGTTFTEIPVTLSWTESRFDDANSITDESGTESYEYNIRLLCKLSATGSV